MRGVFGSLSVTVDTRREASISLKDLPFRDQDPYEMHATDGVLSAGCPFRRTSACFKAVIYTFHVGELMDHAFARYGSWRSHELPVAHMRGKIQIPFSGSDPVRDTDIITSWIKDVVARKHLANRIMAIEIVTANAGPVLVHLQLDEEALQSRTFVLQELYNTLKKNRDETPGMNQSQWNFYFKELLYWTDSIVCRMQNSHGETLTGLEDMHRLEAKLSDGIKREL